MFRVKHFSVLFLCRHGAEAFFVRFAAVVQRYFGKESNAAWHFHRFQRMGQSAADFRFVMPAFTDEKGGQLFAAFVVGCGEDDGVADSDFADEEDGDPDVDEADI